MYRLATCNDLIRLNCKYPDLRFDGVTEWGLKQLGYLYCYDQILSNDFNRVLEAGSGLSLVFDQLIGEKCEYHALDEPGFYDPENFMESQLKRKHTSFHEGLLGSGELDLEENCFDVIFSISSLEHVPEVQIDSVCRDMARLLKPGGKSIHTLDIFGKNFLESHATAYLSGLKKYGLKVETVDMNWSLDRDEPLLFEPLEIVYSYYFGRKNRLWDESVPINHQCVSILISAEKETTY